MRKLIQNIFGHLAGSNLIPGSRAGWGTTPQTRPLRGEDQVRNNAGGFVYGITPWQRLERFLVLGCEGGTFYVHEVDLTIDSAQAVIDCLELDAERTVRTIHEISASGRAPKNRPALFALAIAFCEPTAVPFARSVFSDVARTGTHLFEFLTAVRAMRGFGRALRGTIADWYLSMPVERLGYQLVKYRQRSGWTHRDALRLAHPKDAERDALFAWATGKEAGELPTIVQGFVAAQSTPTDELPGLIRGYGLTHEMVPSGALKDAAVLEALSESMPLGALVRFLGRLGAAGLLGSRSKVTRNLVCRLADADGIAKARLHPMQILVAMRTYASGQGVKGKLSWRVNRNIVDALNGAFHLAFQNVEPSEKRIMVAVDVSGSMAWSKCAGADVLTCAEAAAALTLVTARTEGDVMLKAFSQRFTDLPVHRNMGLDEAIKRTGGMAFGGTDCALPMTWALENKVSVDAFVILTDNETWHGNIHPMKALRRYRKASGIQAKLVVVAMAGTQFSIADPKDPACLDVVGFDTATPRLISDFVAGRL